MALSIGGCRCWQALAEYSVNQPIFNGLGPAHEVIAVGIHGDSLDRLASVSGQNTVQPVANQQDLAGVNIDIAGLALEAAQGLMNHDARMWEAKSLAFCPARQ